MLSTQKMEEKNKGEILTKKKTKEKYFSFHQPLESWMQVGPVAKRKSQKQTNLMIIKVEK